MGSVSRAGGLAQRGKAGGRQNGCGNGGFHERLHGYFLSGFGMVMRVEQV
jgi:hypothetical protein